MASWERRPSPVPRTSVRCSLSLLASPCRPLGPRPQAAPAPLPVPRADKPGASEGCSFCSRRDTNGGDCGFQNPVWFSRVWTVVCGYGIPVRCEPGARWAAIPGGEVLTSPVCPGPAESATVRLCSQHVGLNTTKAGSRESRRAPKLGFCKSGPVRLGTRLAPGPCPPPPSTTPLGPSKLAPISHVQTEQKVT